MVYAPRTISPDVSSGTSWWPLSRRPPLTHAREDGTIGETDDGALARAVAGALDDVRILPLRLYLRTPGIEATVSTLRGVWGAALHDLDPAAFDEVFEGNGQGNRRTPPYVLRPAPAHVEPRPALEWAVFGEAIDRWPILAAAWREAGRRGLGRRRSPFFIDAAHRLEADGATAFLGAGEATTVGALVRDGHASSGERVSLVFDAPLRILREGQLIESPTLADLVASALRRVDLLRSGGEPIARDARQALLDEARSCEAQAWVGSRLDLERYSARQQREIELYGVSGRLNVGGLPTAIDSLIRACAWMHIGKGTTIGLGALRIEPTRG